MKRMTSRRGFLKATGLAGAGLWLGPNVLAQTRGANEKLDVAVIGIEGQGGWNIGQLVEAGANIVALCDVDEPRTVNTRNRFPKAGFTTDYRRLMDRKDFDAVLIATPDHHHAPATMLALKAGKHVYCEKPLTHTVDEARAIAEAAKKYKRVTQMGTQIHARSNYRRVVEAIQRGAIGSVSEVNIWVDRQWGGQDRPPESQSEPAPEGLHWDTWIGPAPMRPYVPEVYTPQNWRGWWDFGGGTLADMGCHYTDLPFWALGLRYPKTVAAEGPPVHADSTPPWMIVRYEFPARKEQPAVKLTWYHGGKRPPLVPKPGGEHKANPAYKGMDHGDGVLFVGSKGMLLANYDQNLLLPEDQFKDYQRPEPFIPESIGHHKEWIEACKAGRLTTTCNFDYAGALTETVLLGNVSYRVGKPLEWDPVRLRARNVPEADKYIRHEYREGWTL
jgi:predicted dehydrogenase